MKSHPNLKTSLGIGLTAIALLLTACGGGGGGGSSNAGSSSQTATGTVTGFGSVFVDGVELEDATAATTTEGADGKLVPTELKIGQRVRVVHDGKGTASTLTVDAAVIGSVSAVDATAGTLTVAGQAVKVNADAAAGPITAFGGGYTALSDVKVADLAQVHGTPVYNSVSKVYEVAATRIEKQAAISAVRVMGKIAALDSTAGSFTINGLAVKTDSTTKVVPDGTVLANDQTVAVWGKSGALTSVGGVPTLSAARVRVFNGPRAEAVTSGTAQLGGLVSNYDATAKTFEIEGVKVSVSSATIITPVTKSVANAAWVQVAGVFGSDGVLAATAIRIREQDTVTDTAKIVLLGPITSFVDSSSFVVRGVPVDATGITPDASCTSALANDVVVKVKAHAQTGTDVVAAEAVSCPKAPAMLIRELTGTAGTVDLTAKTFVLTPQITIAVVPAPVVPPVVWNDKTVFTGVGADTLDGKLVKVEGYIDSAGKLVAREIRLPETRDSDAFAAPGKWDDYRAKIRALVKK